MVHSVHGCCRMHSQLFIYSAAQQHSGGRKGCCVPPSVQVVAGTNYQVLVGASCIGRDSWDNGIDSVMLVGASGEALGSHT